MKFLLKTIFIFTILITAGCISSGHNTPPGFPIHGIDSLKGVKFIPAISESAAKERGIYVGWLYVEPNITVALHTHKISQEKLTLLQGSGILLGKDKDTELQLGDSIKIAPNKAHGLISGPNGAVLFQEYNPGDDGMRIYSLPYINGDSYER
jgi:mannose-6-phosphate isomerase-like protein (cupin superfamily)